jgi:enterochelin esterase-like enzyme
MILRHLALFVLPLLPFASFAQDETAKETHTLRVIARVHADAEHVYVTGNLEEWGPWNPAKAAMTATSEHEYETTVTVPKGSEIEFKITSGSWDNEAISCLGMVPPNYTVTVNTDTTMVVEVPRFKSGPIDLFETIDEAKVLGTLERKPSWHSKFITNSRDVYIWLPPGYAESDARYPVIYMHDGQNLFDPRGLPGGVDWGVDEVIVDLVEQKKMSPAIVVGIANTMDRRREYAPGPVGDGYARFIVEELVPSINSEYRTLTGPQNTTVAGSSMGGLISLYLGWKHPEVFGRAGCFSTFLGQNDFEHLKEMELLGPPSKDVRFYFDYGSAESDNEEYSFPKGQSALNAFFTSSGLVEGKNFRVVVEEGAKHNEAAWRRRLPAALEWLQASEEAK